MRGRYIVLEGGEGVGKTTQTELLVQRLNDAGIPAIEMHEPGGDPMGIAIRSLILSLDFAPEDKTEVLLFNAARVQAMVAINRELELGHWVVSDRSYVSTLAYQGYGRGLNVAQVEAICLYAVGDNQPDLILVMACDAQESLNRRFGRGTTDRMEQEIGGFHRRVNAAFLTIAAEHDMPVIDAGGSVEEVQDLIWQHIQPLTTER